MLFNLTDDKYRTSYEYEQINLDKHTLEFDADTYAISVLYHFGNEALKDYKLIHPERHEIFYETEFDNLKYLGIAIFGKFKLFESEKISLDYILQTSHPPAVLRQRFLMKSIKNAINNPELEDTLFYGVGEGIKHAERGFVYMSVEPPKTILEPEIDEKYNFHWRKIIDNWPRLREFLLPHSYIKLRNYYRSS